jgi:hypothetical protein
MVSQDILDRVMSIVRGSRERISANLLVEKHGFADHKLAYMALRELEARGLITSGPVFYRW